jgi:hypothetical protein
MAVTAADHAPIDLLDEASEAAATPGKVGDVRRLPGDVVELKHA